MTFGVTNISKLYQPVGTNAATVSPHNERILTRKMQDSVIGLPAAMVMVVQSS